MYCLVVVAVLTFASWIPAATAADAAAAERVAGDVPSPDRVRELLTLTGADKQGALLLDELIQNLRRTNPSLPLGFWDELKATLNAGEIVELLIPVYQKHLSGRDVDEAIAYWKTPSGRRMSAAQSLITTESLRVGREWGARVVPGIVEKVRAMPERKLHTGYIDRTGKLAIEPRFTGPGQYAFTEGLARVEVARKVGFIDKSGQSVIEPTLASAYSFSDGLALVHDASSGYGFIDKSGAWVIRPRFLSAESFSEGLAFVVSTEAGVRGVGYIDKAGAFAFPPRPYDTASSFHGGLAAFKVGGKWGFLDRTGRVVSEPRFDDVREAREGLVAVKSGGKWGYMDATGRIVIEPAWDVAFEFHDGLAHVRREGKIVLIDKTGQAALTGPWELVTWHEDGLAAIRSGGQWGFIDRTGKIVIEPQFEDTGGFSEGLAAVKRGDKWGYIDTRGKLVVEPAFDRAGKFSDGMAMVDVWK
jgi:hypothetical protein